MGDLDTVRRKVNRLMDNAEAELERYQENGGNHRSTTVGYKVSELEGMIEAYSDVLSILYSM